MVPLRVDSVAEEYAYLAAHPCRDGTWERVEQRLVRWHEGTERVVPLAAEQELQDPAEVPCDLLRVRCRACGTTRSILFAIATVAPPPDPDGAAEEELDSTVRLWAIAEGAWADLCDEGLLEAEGSFPLHPLPRRTGAALTLLVPIVVAGRDAAGTSRCSVQLVILLDAATGARQGVEQPARPGTPPGAAPDWSAIPEEQLAGLLDRHAAVLERLLRAFARDEEYLQLRAEARECHARLARLYPAPLRAEYRAVAPAFFGWLDEQTGVA